MRRSVGMVMLLLAVLGMVARPADGQGTGVGTIEADAREIAAAVGRAERAGDGGAGAERLSAGRLLAEQVTEAIGRGGVGRGQVFRQGFLITVPEVEECRAVSEAGEVIPVYPLLPMGGQGAAVGEGSRPLEMEVVYGGMGRLEDLRGRDLRGRLVALEMNAREGSVAWQRAAALGAGAILFLGDERTENRWFLEKETTVPLGIPRLYCDDAAWVARLRVPGESAVRRVSLRVRVAWRERALENVVAVFPPASGVGGRGGGGEADHWVIVQSRYDGASQVMGGGGE